MKSFFALALCAAMASAVSAQNVVQTSGQQPTQSSPRGADSKIDQQFASCLILANLGEIKVAEFAQQNLGDGKAKQFAKTLVEDHKQLNSQLKKFAPQAASTTLTSDGRSSLSNQQQRANQRNSTQQGGTNITPGFDNPAQSQLAGAQSQSDQKWFEIEKKATENCVSMTKEALSEKSGKEMGKAFLGCQIASHMQMLAKLKAADGYMSDDLQQVLSKAEQKVQSHLEKAKQLMKEEEKS